MPVASDSEIWDEFGRKAVAGDRNAAAQMLQLYRPALTAVAQKRIPPVLRSRIGASDLVQQTCEDVYSSLSTVRARSGSQLWKWLLSLMLKNLVDARRRFISCQKRSVLRESADAVESMTLTSARRSPLEDLIDQEDAARLQVALGSLPEAYSTVLRWHYHEGQSYSEISVRVERSVDAVRMLLRRAERALAEELKRAKSSAGDKV